MIRDPVFGHTWTGGFVALVATLRNSTYPVDGRATFLGHHCYKCVVVVARSVTSTPSPCAPRAVISCGWPYARR